MNMDSQRLRMVAVEGGVLGVPPAGAARRYEILSRCADANTLAIDANRKDLASCCGGGFFYPNSRPGLNEQRHATAATRSADFSAKSAGFPCLRNDAVHRRS